MVKNCVICGKEFEAVRNRKFCSDECRNKHRLEYQRQYYKDHIDHMRDQNRKLQRKYYRQNREKSQETVRSWIKRNPERYREYRREYMKKWREANPDKVKEYRERSCIEIDREKKNEYQRRYYAKNKDRIRESRRKRKREQKKRLEACMKAHDNCFSCPTEDGECPYD